ncbi:MAG: PspC domain-containing protein [Prevotellaceae bacterium]|nr:PspC domain-containing protein [Prevotellaceae bacterium]MDO4932622.1 PspC domain-containing protein [Prevotellaceae bacterium]
MEKRLLLSKDKKLCGVCAGIAEYFEVDPTLIRVLWVCVTLFSFMLTGIVLYILLAIIIPPNK